MMRVGAWKFECGKALTAVLRNLMAASVAFAGGPRQLSSGFTSLEVHAHSEHVLRKGYSRHPRAIVNIDPLYSAQRVTYFLSSVAYDHFSTPGRRTLLRDLLCVRVDQSIRHACIFAELAPARCTYETSSSNFELAQKRSCSPFYIVRVVMSVSAQAQDGNYLDGQKLNWKTWRRCKHFTIPYAQHR